MQKDPRTTEFELRPRGEGGYALTGEYVGSKGSMRFITIEHAEGHAEFVAKSIPCEGVLRIYDSAGTLQRERHLGSSGKANATE